MGRINFVYLWVNLVIGRRATGRYRSCKPFQITQLRRFHAAVRQALVATSGSATRQGDDDQATDTDEGRPHRRGPARDRAPRKESETIVETIFESIIQALQQGDKIEIRGFGSFRTRQRRGRVGRNPKTGAKVEVPPKKIPFFKPSKELKDFVNTADGVSAA